MNPDDHALQRERTRLAWRRTTLAAAVLLLLVISRLAVGGVRPATAVGSALIALLWVALIGVAHRRIRALSAVRPAEPVRPARTVRPEEGDRGHQPDPARAPAELALLTATLALLAIVLVA